MFCYYDFKLRFDIFLKTFIVFYMMIALVAYCEINHLLLLLLLLLSDNRTSFGLIFITDI